MKVTAVLKLCVPKDAALSLILELLGYDSIIDRNIIIMVLHAK